MKIRFGFITGFASGYYLGTRAGRQRYEQINRAIGKLRESDGFAAVKEKARTAVGRDPFPGTNGQIDADVTVAFVKSEDLT